MNTLYGVMNELDDDVIFTYEAESPEQAAELYWDSETEAAGEVVRVWKLGRYPTRYVLLSSAKVANISARPPINKARP
jgi:hypothetical protein